MFLWNKLAKTAQKDKRNFRVSKVIVIIMKIIILWKKSVVFFLIFRSSRSQIFFKIDVLKNFASFTGKYLCWSLFLNKAAGPPSLFLIKLQALRLASLLKRDSKAGHLMYFKLANYFYEQLLLQDTSSGCFCGFCSKTT